MRGRSVRLYMVHGQPRGLRTAELGNWSGKALICPRTAVSRLLERDECRRTGIYLLFGPDSEAPSGLAVYVGEGDEVRRRIATHDSDGTKEFWTTALVFVSKDENLTKAHARWLECRMVSELKASKRVRVTNSKQPSSGSLPEADLADLETFYDNLSVLLPILGFDVLGDLQDALEQQESTAPPLRLVLKNRHIRADCLVQDGRFVVQAGSTAVEKTKDSLKRHTGWIHIRNWLIEEGVLRPVDGATDTLRFESSYGFDSPSMAAAILIGTTANGRKMWKVKGKGTQTYGQWQDQRLAEQGLEGNGA